MASLQNISFATEPASRVDRIRVQFDYSTDNQQSWNSFSFVLPDDMFDIAVEERKQIAAELIFAIARGKGLIDENGDII